MALIAFGLYTPPEPTGYEVTKNDIDGPSSGRSTSGVMNRKRVRADCYTVKVSWINLTNTDRAAILSAVSGSSFSCTFDNGDAITQKMYTNNVHSNLKYTSSSGVRYWDLDFSLATI